MGAFGILEAVTLDQIVTIIVAIIAASGAWVTARMTGRARQSELRHQVDKQRAADREAEAEQRRIERQTFVQQLREERDHAAARSDKLNLALDRMWADKAASREHVAALRRQIWEGGTPPPVMPPAGYIE